MSVIKLGGCNGSGKTTIARSVIKQIGGKRLTRPLQSGKTGVYYEGEFGGVDFFVLGKYDNACGGMDTISDKVDRLEFVRSFAEERDDAIIFFEGLITGKTYGAMGQLSEQHAAEETPWLYSFMDTPFHVCVERVLLRRAEAGNDAPFDPMRTMDPTFRSCQRLAEKLQNGELPAHPVHIINHKHKPQKAATALLERAWELHDGRS
jgi:hypothetical protein